MESDEEISKLLHEMTTSERNAEQECESQYDTVHQKIMNLQCLFTWKPLNKFPENDLVEVVERKLSKAEEEDEEFIPWRKIILNMILTYEYSQRGAMQMASQAQEYCENVISSVTHDDYLLEMVLGLKHIIFGNKIFLSHKSKKYQDMVSIAKDIADFENMDSKGQACVWGMKAAVFLKYGIEGMEQSISYIETALALDPDYGEWYLLLGLALKGVRVATSAIAIPTKKEIEALEQAVERCKHAFSIVILGQSYLDMSRRLYHNNINISGQFTPFCQEMAENSLAAYKKAIENSKDNVHVLARCAIGILKMPRYLKDISLVERCVLKGLEMDSSNCNLDVAAGLLYKQKGQLDRAKYHFTRSGENGSFESCLELVSIKYTESPTYDPVPDLERYLNRFIEKFHQDILLALIGAFYYLKKQDFDRALEYWLKIIERDIYSETLEYTYCTWSGSNENLNIGKIIVEEVIKRLQERCTERQKIVYEDLLSKYSECLPNLVKAAQRWYAGSARTDDGVASRRNHHGENEDFVSCLELVSIKYTESLTYNPVPDLERYLNRFIEKDHQETLLALIGAFYYLKKQDFDKALEYWLKIVERDIYSERLQYTYCTWSASKKNLNIGKIIVEEVIKRIQERCTERQKIVYEDVLSKYSECHPHVVKAAQGWYAGSARTDDGVKSRRSHHVECNWRAHSSATNAMTKRENWRAQSYPDNGKLSWRKKSNNN